MGQKRCRTKSPRMFRTFEPNLVPKNAPTFTRTFRPLFSGETETRENSPKTPAVVQRQIPANPKIKFTNIFWRAVSNFNQAMSGIFRLLPGHHCSLTSSVFQLGLFSTVADVPESSPLNLEELFVSHQRVSIRGAPSTVKNFMPNSGCSIEGVPPKKKRYQPSGGRTILKLILVREHALFPRVLSPMNAAFPLLSGPFSDLNGSFSRNKAFTPTRINRPFSILKMPRKQSAQKRAKRPIQRFFQIA